MFRSVLSFAIQVNAQMVVESILGTMLIASHIADLKPTDLKFTPYWGRLKCTPEVYPNELDGTVEIHRVPPDAT